jgi:hypothetical protein
LTRIVSNLPGQPDLPDGLIALNPVNFCSQSERATDVPGRKVRAADWKEST